MVNQDAHQPTRSSLELFERGRSRLLASLAGSLANWPESIDAHLQQQAGAADPQTQATLAATGVRFRSAQLTMASRLESCLLSRSDSALNKARSLSQGADLMDSLREAAEHRRESTMHFAQAIRQAAGADYLHWLARNASLLPGLGAMPELDDIHPLGAPLLADCVLSVLAIGSGERNGNLEQLWPFLQQWLHGPCLAHLVLAIREANAYLRDAGVLRSLSRAKDESVLPLPEPRGQAKKASEVSRVSESMNPEVAFAVSAVQAAENLPANELREDLQKPALARIPSLAAVKALESDAVAFAHRVSQVPYTRRARQLYFQAVRNAVSDAKGIPAAGAVVDVVSALFDYVVDEDRLPDTAKPLVWRLQQPVLMLALLDSRYLAPGQRSARDLVENLAAIATGFADEMVPGKELYQRIETAVRAVEIVASMLFSRSQVLSEQVGKHFQATAVQMTSIATRVARERQELESTPRQRNRRRNRSRPNSDAEQMATERLQKLLNEKISLYSVPDSVGEFLRKIWIRHLRTALLRDGEQSGSYATAMRVVDDLLWSADLDAPKPSRRQLTSRIPPLISTLTGGIKETGAQEPDYRAFFDELYLIHLRKLQWRPGQSESGEVLDSIAAADKEFDVPLLTNEVSSSSARAPDTAEQDFDAMAQTARRLARAHDGAAVSARANAAGVPPNSSAQLIEILSMVNVDDVAKYPDRNELSPELALASIETGMWMELLDGSNMPSRAKVAWINHRRTVFLLLRHADRRPLSLNAEHLLERLRKKTAFLMR